MLFFFFFFISPFPAQFLGNYYIHSVVNKPIEPLWVADVLYGGSLILHLI